MTVDRKLAERHYAEHSERPFFGELVDFITSGPLVAMVLEGESERLGESWASGVVVLSWNDVRAGASDIQ